MKDCSTSMSPHLMLDSAQTLSFVTFLSWMICDFKNESQFSVHPGLENALLSSVGSLSICLKYSFLWLERAIRCMVGWSQHLGNTQNPANVYIEKILKSFSNSFEVLRERLCSSSSEKMVKILADSWTSWTKRCVELAAGELHTVQKVFLQRYLLWTDSLWVVS